MTETIRDQFYICCHVARSSSLSSLILPDDQFPSTKFGFNLRIARAAERLRLVSAVISSGEEGTSKWLGSLQEEAAAPSDFEAVRSTLLALAYSSADSDLSLKVISSSFLDSS